MHITETRDMVEGILLALSHEKAAGGVFNLGSTDPFDFAKAVPRMAEATGLPLHVIDLPGAGVFYHTLNSKIRNDLGFDPTWTIDSMIAEAVRTRATKRAS
jgi:UDP-glucose 4-epimerase